MVRNNLEKRGVDPVDCKFRMVGRGPVFDEPVTKTMESHKPIRDQVAALEKKLAEDLRATGYDVMNTVRSSAVLDETLYEQVRAAFAEEFPGCRSAATAPMTAAIAQRSSGMVATAALLRVVQVVVDEVEVRELTGYAEAS